MAHLICPYLETERLLRESRRQGAVRGEGGEGQGGHRRPQAKTVARGSQVRLEQRRARAE